MGNDRKAKYDPKFHDAWAFSLAIRGATDQEVADALGVSRRTVIRWSKQANAKGEEALTSFGEALRSGKEQADAQVERKLYERCLGYDVEEEQKTIDVNKDGSSKIGQIRTNKKHIPPDTMAIMYWLNNRNRKSGKWAQKQEVSVNISENQEDVVIYIPDNGRDKT